MLVQLGAVDIGQMLIKYISFHNIQEDQSIIMPFPTSMAHLLFLLVLGHCQAVDCDFEQFISDFSKNYSAHSAEYHYRELIFMDNCDWVNTVNNDPNSTYRLMLTKCSDLTEAECQKQWHLNLVDLSSLKQQLGSGPQLTVSSPMVSAVPPATLNYNTLGFVTSVKNQGACGCCWAFSSVATYESWLLMKGFNLGLSEQAVLQCTYLYALNRRPSNCTAGYITDAMIYLAKVGGVLGSNYPYTADSVSSGFPPSTPGICTDTNRIYLGNGTAYFYDSLTTAQIKQLLTDTGPLMVGISADAGFTAYTSGVYTGCPANAASLINHAVELIGYDASNNWIIKNQWGTGWGESGFMTVSNSLDCGLSKAIIGITFPSFNADVSVTFDPTVYVTAAPLREAYLVGLAVAAWLLLM